MRQPSELILASGAAGAPSAGAAEWRCRSETAPRPPRLDATLRASTHRPGTRGLPDPTLPSERLLRHHNAGGDQCHSRILDSTGSPPPKTVFTKFGSI